MAKIGHFRDLCDNNLHKLNRIKEYKNALKRSKVHLCIYKLVVLKVIIVDN